MEYIAKYNRVWQNIKTGVIGSSELLLKEGDKITNYRQIPTPKENLQEQQKELRTKKRDFSFAATNSDDREGGL